MESKGKPSTADPPSAGDGSTLLLRAPEAAKTLAIGERKLWELTNRGEIPCVRIGRAVRYVAADLDAFIERLQRAGDRR